MDKEQRIGEIAQGLFQMCLEVHQFCKKNPDCFLVESWEQLMLSIKENYLKEARQIRDKLIPQGDGEGRNPMDTIPSETIYSDGNLVIPLADVQHIEKKYYSQDMMNPDVKKNDLSGILVVMKSTKWNMEHDVWDGGIWIDRFKSEGFIKAWCYFRYEIDGIKAQMEGLNGK